MVGQYIEINQSIQITLDNEEDDWNDSIIQDVSKDFFNITIPYHNGVPMIFNKGDKVKVSISTQSGKIIFNTKVMAWITDNIPLLVLGIPDKYEHIQLRNFVRLPLMMDVFYAEIPEEGKDPNFIKTTSLDISGGGIRISVKKTYPTDTVLLLKFSVTMGNKVEELTLSGKIVRYIETEMEGVAQLGLCFIQINRKQEDLLVRFVLNKMAEFKKRF